MSARRPFRKHRAQRPRDPIPVLQIPLLRIPVLRSPLALTSLSIIPLGLTSLLLALAPQGLFAEAAPSAPARDAAPSAPAPGPESVAPAPEGGALYQPCATCHGGRAEGQPALGAPALAGLDADYIARQLRLYRSGARGSDPRDTFGQQMAPMARMLPSDAAVDAVAAFAAALPAPSLPALSKGDAAAGKAAYGLCATCHGARAEGIPAMKAPALTALDAEYLERQLLRYREGSRGADPRDAQGAQMSAMAKALSGEAAVVDVVAYIEGLRPGATSP